ncbi:MAG: ATP-binding protein [Opitutales bacterium]|nr:ATP-binding protein [Opitutales bacterium]
MSLPRKKLPIGIQNLREIREGGRYYYVDKSGYAVRLATEGKYYFLSRPRRFGKSLFLDTLKELFEANRPLFEGLYAADHWDWSVQHPVIRVSFAEGSLKNHEQLGLKMDELLRSNARRLGVEIREPTLSGRFRALIEDVAGRVGRTVVILIDEYDKPILDNIENAEVATAMRDGLRDFYSVIKDADPHLRFVLLTGVSKFSKVSLFSGLNNLNDITLDAPYSAICGYTEDDVDTVFAPELEGLDREQIREWYNGYNWTGEAVYNPFDLLLLFDKREFKAWWYSTGTPTFLMKLLTQRERFLPELQDLLVDDLLLSTFDVNNIPTESLLFQTGYLTIAEKQNLSGSTLYRLKYPNREVYQSLTEGVLRDWTPVARESTLARVKLHQLLEKHDLAGVGRLMAGFYESIPHQWYTKNTIAQYEGYYASVFYAFFASLGLEITLEESSNAGRLDMVVRFRERAIIFEFKLVDDEATPGGNSALAAINERGYAERWRAEGSPVDCVGIEFSRKQRRIVAWDVGSGTG